MRCGGPQGSLQRASFEEFRSQMEARIEAGLEKYHVPGASLALVHRGAVVGQAVFGVARRGEPDLVARDTLFQVASISKPVSALGVLLLAETGALDLDQPVASYLQRWSFPGSRFDSPSITARQLLSHTAGTNIHGYPGFLPESSLPTLLESLDGMTAGAGRVTVRSPPGKSVAYSSGGYTVLQLLVEEVSGQSFESYMKRHVLDPAGMSASSFSPATGAHATGHGWWGQPLPLYKFRARAASGLQSTASDLARFIGHLFGPTAVGLSAGLRDAMLRPLDGRSSGFSLGFAMEGAPGIDIVLHTGANRGWRSILAVSPETGDGLVLLTNSDRGLPLTTEALCSWGEWVTGGELASCWADRKSRGTILAVAILLGVGLILNGWGLALRYLSSARRRLPGPVERYRWLRWPRLVLSLVVLTLWWVFWYSDRVAVLREGIENIIPVASLPPTFSWLTAVVTLWCLLGMVRSILGTRHEETN